MYTICSTKIANYFRKYNHILLFTFTVEVAIQKTILVEKGDFMIQNPMLKGFNPYSCAIRVGDDFYMVQASYEWWPGVTLYHSHDLEKWEIHSYPLNRMSQLDLRGVPNGGGVVSASLSYDGSKFYLAFTNMKSCGEIEQTDNYLVTTDDINDGIWSEPVYLNSLGINPYLFHMDDCKYLLSVARDYRKDTNSIYIREYSIDERTLVGDNTKIYSGNAQFGALYYKDSYFCLVTEKDSDKTSVALSSSELFGTYSPDTDILTNYELSLQETALASFVKAQTKKANSPSSIHYDFKTMGKLDLNFQTLRGPLYQALTLCSQGMVLRGQDGLLSRFDQSVVAHKIESDNCHIETKLEFEPECEKHMAGLIIYNNTKNWIYECITKNEETNKREIALFVCKDGRVLREKTLFCEIEDSVPVLLSVDINNKMLTFSYTANNNIYELDALFDLDSLCSDSSDSFMAALCVQDMSAKEKEAVFEHFDYCIKEVF